MAKFQSRKFQLTINNPIEYGFTHKIISELLIRSNPDYYCMVDEIGENGTYHTHIFIYSTSPIRFSTLKNRFPQAHIEAAYGSVIQNVEYIKKEGKWAETNKSETSVLDTFEEYGEIPSEKQEEHPELAEIIEDIENGKQTGQIVKEHPKYALKSRNIDDLRETLISEKYSQIIREINVIYLFSQTAVDLIGCIYDKYNPNEVCRITNYGKNGHINFDNYKGQSVIVFDNFNSQIDIEDMLVYLDKYPCELPARYNNHTASYTTVYFISLIPPERQYLFLKGSKDVLLRRFFSRIDKVIEVTDDGEIVETNLKEEKK